MQPDPTIVDSLVALNGDIDSIRGLWEQALQALVDRATINVHITSTTRDGRQAAGMTLADDGQIRTFCASCKEAIRLLEREAAEDEDDAHDPYSLGRGSDRSGKIIRV